MTSTSFARSTLFDSPMRCAPFIAVALVLLIAVGGCTSKRGTTPGDPARSDTMSMPEQLPPRTVLLEADVVACDTSQRPQVCTLRIGQVLRYGRDTPVLADGAEVKTLVNDDVLDAHGTELAPGDAVSVLLGYQEAPQLPGGAPASPWAVRTFYQ